MSLLLAGDLQAQCTASGYAASLPVCGQTVSGTALRRALGLRSACFTIRYQDGSFLITTKGYGHGVGLSQWGAKALAEQAGPTKPSSPLFPGDAALPMTQKQGGQHCRPPCVFLFWGSSAQKPAPQPLLRLGHSLSFTLDCLSHRLFGLLNELTQLRAGGVLHRPVGRGAAALPETVKSLMKQSVWPLESVSTTM